MLNGTRGDICVFWERRCLEPPGSYKQKGCSALRWILEEVLMNRGGRDSLRGGEGGDSGCRLSGAPALTMGVSVALDFSSRRA